jgi:hypothetical protein
MRYQTALRPGLSNRPYFIGKPVRRGKRPFDGSEERNGTEGVVETQTPDRSPTCLPNSLGLTAFNASWIY